MASFAGCNIIQPTDDGNIKIKITITNVEFDAESGGLGFDASAEASVYEVADGVENLATTYTGAEAGLLIECSNA